MLSPKWFFKELKEREISFFAGVPDSLLKEFCALLDNTLPPQEHLIAANEGNAIALATGYHLATGKTGMVYMQNSGLGNTVNPLMSLVAPNVYSIPILLLIGWRGEPGKLDEPQHITQGAATLSQLKTLNIPYAILPTEEDAVQKCLDTALKTLQENKVYALVVRKNSFSKHKSAPKPKSRKEYALSREDAVRQVASSLHERSVIVSTTGKTSRELFEYRAESNHPQQDFLMVGSMGHASQIALGIAIQKPNRQIFCFDGDGALIMHMGGLAVIGAQSLSNFKHIIFNNGAHDSVGGQPTATKNLDIPALARACGYEAKHAENEKELADALTWLQKTDTPALLEIRVKKGARADLGRPTQTPHENKQNFMRHLEG